MRIIVCGGRDYTDRKHVFWSLDNLEEESGPITLLAQGGERGADAWAFMWAKDVLKLPRECRPTFKADWDKFGKRAGPIRNTKMLKETMPNLVVAFPGGTGTADMVGKALAAKVPVLRIPASRGQVVTLSR